MLGYTSYKSNGCTFRVVSHMVYSLQELQSPAGCPAALQRALSPNNSPDTSRWSAACTRSADVLFQNQQHTKALAGTAAAAAPLTRGTLCGDGTSVSDPG